MDAPAGPGARRLARQRHRHRRHRPAQRPALRRRVRAPQDSRRRRRPVAARAVRCSATWWRIAPATRCTRSWPRSCCRKRMPGRWSNRWPRATPSPTPFRWPRAPTNRPEDLQSHGRGHPRPFLFAVAFPDCDDRGGYVPDVRRIPGPDRRRRRQSRVTGRTPSPRAPRARRTLRRIRARPDLQHDDRHAACSSPARTAGSRRPAAGAPSGASPSATGLAGRRATPRTRPEALVRRARPVRAARRRPQQSARAAPWLRRPPPATW